MNTRTGRDVAPSLPGLQRGDQLGELLVVVARHAVVVDAVGEQDDGVDHRRVVLLEHRLVGDAGDLVQRGAGHRDLAIDRRRELLAVLADRADRHDLPPVRVLTAEVRAEHPQADLVGVLELVEGAEGGGLGEVELGLVVRPGELTHRSGDVEHEQDPGLLAQLGPRLEDRDQDVRSGHLQLGLWLRRVDAVGLA